MALKVDSWSLAEKLYDSDFDMFASNGERVPYVDTTEWRIENEGEYFYHVQGSQAAGPIRTVRTGLTEPPENMKEIISNTNTSNKENGVEIDQVFNYYPTGSGGFEAGQIRNPLSYCRSFGPC